MDCCKNKYGLTMFKKLFLKLFFCKLLYSIVFIKKYKISGTFIYNSI